MSTSLSSAAQAVCPSRDAQGSTPALSEKSKKKNLPLHILPTPRPSKRVDAAPCTAQPPWIRAGQIAAIQSSARPEAATIARAAGDLVVEATGGEQDGDSGARGSHNHEGQEEVAATTGLARREWVEIEAAAVGMVGSGQSH